MTTQEEPIIPEKTRKRRRWLWLIASPFLFFLLLILLLYLPPVQHHLGHVHTARCARCISDAEQRS